MLKKSRKAVIWRYLSEVDEELNDWFARTVLPHEAALVRYLLRIWPHKEEVIDLRQEVYVRVYEAARKSRPTFVKSFLFTTARNLLADRARRARVVSIEALGDFDVEHALVDEVSPERHLHAREELKLLARAFRRLPPKCREVVWLRRVDELSQRDVAERLGVSARTVERHLENGMKVVANALFSRGAITSEAAEPVQRGRDKHGKPSTN